MRAVGTTYRVGAMATNEECVIKRIDKPMNTKSSSELLESNSLSSKCQIKQASRSLACSKYPDRHTAIQSLSRRNLLRSDEIAPSRHPGLTFEICW
jgi:hypothetical protein